MKVALYLRVSTEDQVKEGTSLEVQKEYLMDYAKRNNYKVFDVYSDDGISGYTTERPQLIRLFKDARKKKFELVLVYKIDRFSRNLKNLLNLVDELEDVGVFLKSATEMYDTTNSAGKMMFQQLGSFAEFERNRIKERVFPGMVKGVKKGNWQGSRYVPYGYSYDKAKKELKVVPKEAKRIKQIYKMYLSGIATPQIAKFFFEKGYKTRSGGLFNTKFIRDILRNQLYIGKLVWNRYHYDTKNKTNKWGKRTKNAESKLIIADGKHKPIISEKDFLTVQKKLDSNRRGAVNRKGCLDYVLTGVLLCGKCGHRFIGHKNLISRMQPPKYKRYYRCNRRSEHGITCNNTSVSADQIETEVYRIIEIICSQELTQERLKSLIQENPIVNDKKLRAELKDIKDKLKLNITKQERLGQIYADGLLAIEAYKNTVFPLKTEENNLKDQITKYELNLIQKERSEEYLELIKTLLDKEIFNTKKKQIDILEQRNLMKVIFKYIKVENGNLTDFELYEPFKSLYKGAPISWQVKENQRVTEKDPSVVCLLPTAAK